MARLSPGRYIIAVGIGFGIIAVGGIFSTLFITPIVWLDPYPVAVVSAAVFAGSWAAVITALLTGVGHLLGMGMLTMELVLNICSALVLGALFHRFWVIQGHPVRSLHFWVLGVALAVLNTASLWITAWADSGISSVAPADSGKSLAIGLVFYPLAVYLLCQFIFREFRRVEDESALSEANRQLIERSRGLETTNLNLEQEIARRQQVEDALRENEGKYRAIIEQSGEGLLITNTAGDHLLVNPKFCELTGYSATELQGLSIQDLLSKDSRISLFPKVIAEGSGKREVKLIRKGGSSFYAEIGGYPINLGEERLALGIVRDITDRKQAEDSLRESEERFRNLVEGSVQGIVIDCADKPLFVNQTYASIFGFASPDEVLSLDSLDSLYAPVDAERIHQYRGSLGNDSTAVPVQYEFQGRRKDGSLIWLEAQSRMVNWQGMAAVQSTVVDISERKTYQAQLLRQAHFDKITDLPNRALALDRLAQAVIRAERNQSKAGLLFIDLDQFKQINDTLGHSAGDLLLKQAGVRLSKCVRQEDTVARLGGDEFTVILPDLSAPLDTTVVARKIIDAFSKCFVIDGYEVFVTPSIGITICPDDGNTPSTLMRNSDAAMYQAKEIGRNNYQFFTPSLNQKALNRLKIDSCLRNALERGELTLHYQPIIDLRSGAVVSVEALARWHNPELGQIGPDQFIPIAEETGLIIPIGEWVLQTACLQSRAWQSEGLPPLRLTVNVSSRQFRGNQLVHAVVQALQKSGLAADFLELEITETLLMTDLPETTNALQELHALGVRLSVDDFGTGYSSLSYLRRFPVDTLKIDKSFIGDVGDDPDDAALVEAIIAMGRSLNLDVAAEGVETREQLEFLRVRACDLAQGYYFGRPMPPERFAELFKDWMLLPPPE
ncbi:MAG: EAL domain-containing protein [Candidatus Competibacteraceae bacterium]|nr:EAL domain-containing protein [Candidatus Competibacteraceae bacterium]